MSRSNTAYISIRMTSLVGPSENEPQNVLYKFVENALTGMDIVIRGGGQGFIVLDVRDMAEAIIRLLLVPVSAWDNVYNLGPEKQTGIVIEWK